MLRRIAPAPHGLLEGFEQIRNTKILIGDLRKGNWEEPFCSFCSFCAIFRSWFYYYFVHFSFFPFSSYQQHLLAPRITRKSFSSGVCRQVSGTGTLLLSDCSHLVARRARAVAPATGGCHRRRRRRRRRCCCCCLLFFPGYTALRPSPTPPAMMTAPLPPRPSHTLFSFRGYGHPDIAVRCRRAHIYPSPCVIARKQINVSLSRRARVGSDGTRASISASCPPLVLTQPSPGALASQISAPVFRPIYSLPYQSNTQNSKNIRGVTKQNQVLSCVREATARTTHRVCRGGRVFTPGRLRVYTVALCKSTVWYGPKCLCIAFLSADKQQEQDARGS